LTAPPASVPGAAAPAAIGQKVVRGSVLLIIMGIVSRALGVVGTLVLTHLIAPDAYGEVSDATVVAFTINMIANVGVGVYVIAHPKSTREELFHAAVMHVALGVLFLAPLPLIGPALGRALEAPTMYRYLPGMMLTVLFERFIMIPDRILVREMRFGTVSWQRAVGEILYTVVSVGGAAFGLGAMAVVAGNVVRSGSRTVVLLRVVDWRQWLWPCRLRWETCRRIVRFGIPISLGNIVGFALRRWDNLVVSRLHGAAAVGAYNLAYNLADIPAVQVGEQITDALQVTFTGEGQSDPLRRLLRSVAVLALIMTPLAVGLGAVAPTLTALLLNRRWAEVGPMLVWLSVISFPRPLSGAVASYMQVRHRRRAYLALEVFTLVTLLASLFTLGRLSPVWACVAVGATFVLRLVAAGLLLWRIDGVSFWSFLRPQLPPVAAALIMAAAVTAVRLGLERAGVPNVVSLAAQVLVGGVTYLGAAWVVARETSRDVLNLVLGAFARRRRRNIAPNGAGEPR
jgi:PST family polysaccharide transporter